MCGDCNTCSCRGSGIGTALVQELVQRAGGTPIYLITPSQRTGLFQRCVGAGRAAACALPSCHGLAYAAPGLHALWQAAGSQLAG